MRHAIHKVSLKQFAAHVGVCLKPASSHHHYHPLCTELAFSVEKEIITYVLTKYVFIETKKNSLGFSSKKSCFIWRYMTRSRSFFFM